MADIWQVTNARLSPAIDRSYERLLASLGNGDFGATVRGCVDALTAGATRIYLFEATGDSKDEFLRLASRFLGPEVTSVDLVHTGTITIPKDAHVES